jgi:hypothetical protein
MPVYASTDPNFGLVSAPVEEEPKYASTDPNFGLEKLPEGEYGVYTGPGGEPLRPGIEEGPRYPEVRLKPGGPPIQPVVPTEEEAAPPGRVREVSLRQPRQVQLVETSEGPRWIPKEAEPLPPTMVPGIAPEEQPSYEQAVRQAIEVPATAQGPPIAEPPWAAPPVPRAPTGGAYVDELIDATTNQFLQSAISQAAPIVEGAATATQLRLGPAGVQPMPGETFESTMQRLQQSQDPLLAGARALPEFAAQQFPVSPQMAGALPVKLAGMAGEFAPVLATGTLAPFTIAQQTMGAQVQEEYRGGLAEGLPPNVAARQAFDHAIKAGMTAEALWSVLPGPLKSAFDRYMIEQVGGAGFKRFVAGRVAKAGEGAVLGATTQAGQNLATGRPVTEGVGHAAASMAAANVLFPGAKTSREMLLDRQRYGAVTERTHPPDYGTGAAAPLARERLLSERVPTPSLVSGAIGKTALAGRAREFKQDKARADETAARASEDIAKTNFQRVLDTKVSVENNAQRLRNALPKERRSRNDAQQIRNSVAFFKQRLVQAARAALKQPWAREASRQYRGYNIRSHDLADEFGKKPETVMVAESGLSPNTSPEQSFEATRRLMKMLRDNTEDRFDNRMADWARNLTSRNDKGETVRLYDDADLRYLLGKKFSELPENDYIQAKWMRAFDEVYHPDKAVRVVRPDGTLGDFERTATGKRNPFAWTTFKMMQNGIDALRESRPVDEILSTPKVANYYMSKLLAFQRSNHVVVDTHHTSAAFGNSIPSSHELVTKTFAAGRGGPEREFGGLYSIIHEATVQAAREIGIDPKEFQALVWSYQRGYKSPTAFGRTTEGKEAVKQIQQLWEDAARGRITERKAYEGTEKIARDFHGGRVPAPSYYGKGPRGEGAPAKGTSGQPAELPTRGGLRERAGPGVGGDVATGIAEGVTGREKEITDRGVLGGGFRVDPSGNAGENGRTFEAGVRRTAEEHPHGAAVTLKDPAFYRDPNTQLFLSGDKSAGAAVAPDGELVSVFKHPDSQAKIGDILAEAAPNATHLEAFATGGRLPELYAQHGFRPVARIAFDRAQAPKGWDYAKHGEPDIVLMARDPANRLNLPDVRANGYKAVENQIPVLDYDAAQARLRESLDSLQRETGAAPLSKEAFAQLSEQEREIYNAGNKLRLRAQNEGGYTTLFDAAVDFGRQVYGKGLDFARWSAEMIRHLGDSIREHLGAVWEAINPRGLRAQIARLESELELERSRQQKPPGTEPPPEAQPPHEQRVTTEAQTEEQPILGGPGTPGAGEIPEPRVTGLKNRIIDEERAKRGWLPLMSEARKANPETWNQAMDVLERNESAGTQMVDDINSGRKKSVDAVDHAVLTHERIRVMNESAMEAERASDMSMTEQERDEAHVRWGVLEDRLNETDQALRQAGTATGRSLQFRQALIRDDYTFDGIARKARAQKKGPLTLEESLQIQKQADEISKAEQAAAAHEAKVTDQNATDQAKEELGATRQRTSRTRAPASLDADHAKILTAISEHVKEGGDLSGLRPLVRKLAENYVRRGINKLQPLTRALHETLSKIVPDITPTEVRDLFSGYGDFRPLNKDAVQAQLRDLRGQAQQAGKIGDMIAKQAPKKTGPERRTPSAHERTLTKLVNELKKKGGYVVTDPATQLKSALGAIKTNLKNQIETLTRQLFTGERPAKKGAIEYDVETEKLRALRDQIKQSVRDVSDTTLTDEQRLAAATKAAARNLDYWTERLRLAKEGVFKTDRETGKPIADPELDAMRARIKAVKAEIDELRKLANPAKTPEEKALASYQARLFNRMADLQDRLARGDFAPRPRKQITLDQETLELKAQAERMKRKIDQGLAKQRLAERAPWEKALEGLSKWRRAFVLSWPTVLAKLTTASSYLIGSAPLEEAVRTPLRHLLPAIAEKAPRYGRGFHLQTEVGAIAHTWKTLFSAAGKKWKTGQGDIDALYGDPKVLPPELKELVGNLHAALKEPARQNEFFRSFQTRLWHAGRKGADVTDPLVQTKIATDAYKDANAQIFSENNMVADFIKRGMSRFRQVDKETGRPTVFGKVAEAGVKYTLPVIRIPLNLIKRTFEYSLGTATGSVRLAGALIKGIDKLSPEQADVIMRNLSRGQVGLAFMAYGFFNPTQFGGYYQRGEKRDPDDIAAGHARVLGLDIPHYLIHSPLLAQLQIGSTIRRIVDGNAAGKDEESPGYAKAIMQAYAGVIQETPLVRAAEDNLRALDIRERDRFFGQLMQSTVPGAVEWTAKHFDSDADGNTIQRKPTAPFEYFKQAVPGLRQQVPTKEEIQQQKKMARRFRTG